MASTLKTGLTITHIGTATALLELDGLILITDPYLSPAETGWPAASGIILTSHYTPSHTLTSLPPIDAVLLSHEDHPDNLDELGRRLLDGRRVLTTMDGARKLAPRPGVKGLQAWETYELVVAGKKLDVMGTPCVHLPGGECTGFVLSAPSFGTTGGLPNAVYFSGDTVYMDELVRIRDRFHVSVALFNIGAAKIRFPGMEEPLMITMDGKQAARLFEELGADVLVPMHFEAWDHFSEGREALGRAFEESGVMGKVVWLEPGVAHKLA